MTRRPRLLLDTEVLLRAWRNDGPARELLQRAVVRDVSLCTSTTLLDELDDVLARPKFAAPVDERQQFRRSVLLAADRFAAFDEADSPRRSPDPGDDHVIEAALRTGADIVVSQNAADLTFADYEVLTAAEACERVRATGPFGATALLAPEDVRRQGRELAETGGDPHNLRRGADIRFREIIERLEYTAVDDRCRFSVLAASPAATLTAELVRVAGRGLLVDLAGGGSFDEVGGTWGDVPARDGAVPFDLVWYSSERAPAEAISSPEAPTITGEGWLDEHRHRTLLVGAVVVVLATRGPFGEPDVRFLALVGEPLPVVPEIDNAYRRATTSAGTLRVVHRDPAGFDASMTMTVAGGPGAILFPTRPPPRAAESSFRLARDLCRRVGWPTG